MTSVSWTTAILLVVSSVSMVLLVVLALAAFV